MKKLTVALSSLCLSAILIAPSTSASPSGQESRNALPEIGGAAVNVLSLEKERIYGDAMMRQLRATQPLLHDPVLEEYINDLGNKLVKNADDVNYSFNFFLVNRKEINAFAFFGGNIGVHSGLITLADQESELASVLAHEISHVTQRHLARKLESSQRSGNLTTAGLISSVLLTLVNPQLGMAALSTTIAASQQASINYTRINEKEADRVGLAVLARSGFNPAAASHFFGKLAEKYRYASKPPAMLLTHPLPESRISDMRTRVQRYGSKLLPPSLDFELAKARISARYERDPESNIIIYQQELVKRSYKIKEAAEYGLSMAFFEDGQFKKAEEILLELMLNDKNNLFYADLLTDVFIKQKKYTDALAMLKRLFELMPNNQVVTLNYANAAMEAGNYELAETLLQDFIITQPKHFLAHDLLSSVFEKQKEKAKYHSTKAEVYALVGNFNQAIDELQTGYKYTEDSPLLKKRIKARINQLRQSEAQMKRL